MIYFVMMLALAYLSVYAVSRISIRYKTSLMFGLFCAFLIMANFLANKIILVGPLEVPAGIVLFSMSFLITDFINEVEDEKVAIRLVNLGIVVNIITTAMLALTFALPSPEHLFDKSNYFAKALGSTPRIVFAGLIAFVVSQHLDVWVFSRLKSRDRNTRLWLRNNLSTIISQLIDSTLFICIAFAGVLPVVPLIIGQFVIKTIIAVFDTPFLYMMVRGDRLDIKQKV